MWLIGVIMTDLVPDRLDGCDPEEVVSIEVIFNRALQGETSLWVTVVQQLEGPLRGTVRTILPYCGEEDLRDIVQETVTKIWMSRNRFDHKKGSLTS